MADLKVSADGRFCVAPDGSTSVFDRNGTEPSRAREPSLAEMEEIASQMQWVSVPITCV
jgi:hypothetical protein